MILPVSIVMPLYNKEDHIEKTINSILNQKYTNYELIIVNDGSTDNSLNIVRKFKDSRIKIINQHNSGISIAKNIGIINSSYDLIFFIDADDVWRENHIDNIVSLSLKYNNASVFVSGYSFITNDNVKNILVNSTQNDGLIKDYFKFRLLSWGVSTSASAVRKNAIYNIGGFPFLIKSNDYIYLLDINLKKILKNNYIKNNVGVWINYLNEDLKLSEINLPKILAKGFPAEDQYLYDMLATKYVYAYTNELTVNYYANIVGQASRDQVYPIYPNLIGLNEFYKKNKKKSSLKYNQINLNSIKKYIILLKVSYYLRSCSNKLSFIDLRILYLNGFINFYSDFKLITFFVNFYLMIEILLFRLYIKFCKTINLFK